MADRTNQIPTKRQFLFNPLKRPMPYIGLILAVLIIIFQGTIRQYTANVVGGWLVSSLNSSTQGNYTLEYDFVRFDIFTKELRIKNLDLKLDTTVISPEEYLKDYSNLIDLSTPTVVLKLESLWELLVNDKLRIAYIGLERPRVDLIRSATLSDEQTLENQQQTTEEIRSYLEEIEIDSFRIVHGSLRIDLQDDIKGEIFDYSVGDFSTMLKSFQLSNIDPDKPFQGIYVEEVELEIRDQEIRMPRLNHDVQFNRLWVSSEDSIIQVDSVLVQPISKDSIGIKGNVFLKQMALNNLDFKKIYDEFSIDLGTLKLDQLNIDIQNSNNRNAEQDNLNKLILPFKDYTIDTIQLLNTAVNLELNRKISVDNMNFELRNYSIDSSGLSPQKLLENVSEFDLSLQNSYVELPDSIHESKIRRIDISSNSRDIILRGIRINPIADRRNYSLYKQQGANLIAYGSISRIELNKIRFDELLRNHQLYADSLNIISPSANLTQYPYIQKVAQGNQENFPYLIENINVSNGRLSFNRRQNARDNRSEVSGINLEIKGFYPKDASTPTFDQLHLTVSEGTTELNDIKHRLSFNDLTSTDLRRFDINRFALLPDSATNQSTYEINGTGFSLIGYSKDFLADPRFIELEEVSAQSIQASINIRKDSIQKTNKQPSELQKLVINRFYFNEADVNFENEDIQLAYDNLSSFADSLQYSADDTTSAIPIRFKDLQLTHGTFSISSKNGKGLSLNGQLGKFSEVDSLISFSDLEYKIDDKLEGTLKNIDINGFERDKYLKSKILDFNYAILDQHKMEVHLGSNLKSSDDKLIDNEQIKEALLDEFRSIDFDSILYRDGNISLTSTNRTTNLSNSNIKLIGYSLDSLTDINKVLKPDEFRIDISKILSTSNNDSVEITGITADFVRDRIMTGKIELGANLESNGRLEVISPGLSIIGLELSNLIKQDFSTDTILFNNVEMKMTTTDSSNSSIAISSQTEEIKNTVAGMFKKSNGVTYDSILRTQFGLIELNKVELDSNNNIDFAKILGQEIRLNAPVQMENDSSFAQYDNEKTDTILHASPTSGKIGYVGMSNASFSWNKNGKPNDYLGNLKFSLLLDQISLDTLNSFNIYDHIHDLKIDIKDYSLNLPDSLNSISVDRLSFSSNDESVHINNLQLTPLVDKYEYADKVGHQAGWHHLSELDIDVRKLDLHRLINEQIVHIQGLETNGGILDIFKDKELPVPDDQYRPMLQDAIKSIKVPFIIDSLDIAGFDVHFTSRLSADLPEGSLSFYDIDGKSQHITNIDTLLFDQPELNLAASTKIMNDGLLKANFSFNMIDPENRFKFDANLDAMSAQDFNNLLEATAYVKIESGDIKNIALAASGDNYYATGKMTFQYNNLKVSTINKRNLKTTGMGKVMKTFFANAFVVKKNNPAVKFFPREGDMYYERDTQKIIIDYVAKTAMSGVISSIGARNFRKEIRQIQKDSRKQLDEEKKAQRKAGKIESAPIP